MIDYPRYFNRTERASLAQLAEALLSGEYKQGRKTLVRVNPMHVKLTGLEKVDHVFCCLGVWGHVNGCTISQLYQDSLLSTIEFEALDRDHPVRQLLKREVVELVREAVPGRDIDDEGQYTRPTQQLEAQLVNLNDARQATFEEIGLFVLFLIDLPLSFDET